MGVYHPKAVVNDVVDYYDMVSIIIEEKRYRLSRDELKYKQFIPTLLL